MRLFPRAIRWPHAAAIALALTLFPGGSPSEVEAQQIPSRSVLENLSPEQIRQRLRASGLSEAQVRDRLRQAGYDPALADRYFDDEADMEVVPGSPEDLEFLQVLQSIGLDLRATRDSTLVRRDTLLFGRDTLELVEEPDSAGLDVFGIDVFRSRTNQFQASPVAAVGPNYPLGAGDEVVLVLTGDVQRAYRLPVSAEGLLVIPQVGQIPVTGMTLGSLEERLYDRLGQVYSGVSRSAGATTQFSVSLGRVRSIQVYVLGEVQRPGAYSVSARGTVLEALYQAGGPRETGSFRRVVVRRGGQVVGAYDLYDYLTAGSTEGAIRLQDSDVVFVPPVGEQVAVRGEVLRPAIYEVLPGEGLPMLVEYFGGLRPTARTDVVRVDRVVPWNDRTLGRDREVMDVNLGAVLSGADTFRVRGGDEVEVFPVLESTRGWVDIGGAVYRPGRYQLRPDATLATLIGQAGGTLPDVLDPVIHVSSLDVTNGTRRLARVPLGIAESIPLREYDAVTLFGRDSLLIADSVGVFGLVRKPGRYALSEGATAEDLVLLAGGLAFGADPRQAELIRMTTSSEDGVEVSTSVGVRLSDAIPFPGPGTRASLPTVSSPLVPSESIALAPGDEIYVRQIPQYRRPRRVEITGEVVAPGTYVLERMDERVSSVLRRSGGLTARAFGPGFRLIRDGITVGVDLNQALREPNGPDDPVLVDGDRLVVPILDATVLVTGAVAFQTRVVFRPGMELSDVLSQAGGLTPEADQGRISVEYANGSRRTVKRTLGINFSVPEIRPGSTVFVPSEPEGGAGFDWNSALAAVLAVASTTATLIIAAK